MKTKLLSLLALSILSLTLFTSANADPSWFVTMLFPHEKFDYYGHYYQRCSVYFVEAVPSYPYPHNTVSVYCNRNPELENMQLIMGSIIPEFDEDGYEYPWPQIEWHQFGEVLVSSSIKAERFVLYFPELDRFNGY